jgi:hypothetical protein
MRVLLASIAQSVADRQRCSQSLPHRLSLPTRTWHNGLGPPLRADYGVSDRFTSLSLYDDSMRVVLRAAE